MTHDETTELMDDILLVRERNKDLTIIIVEHEMGVIERITDRCVVLNFGRKIAEGPYRQVAADRAGAGSLSRGCLMSGAAGHRGRLSPPMTRPTCCEGVSLTVEPGRITCLLGSNGSGKTTLIRSILGLTPPRAGRIMFDGADITAAADAQDDRAPASPAFRKGARCFPNSRSRRTSGSAPIRKPRTASRRRAWPTSYDIFPRLAERRGAARRHHVGRRAGDGVDRPRADAGAEAAC